VISSADRGRDAGRRVLPWSVPVGAARRGPSRPGGQFRPDLEPNDGAARHPRGASRAGRGRVSFRAPGGTGVAGDPA